MSMVQMMNSAAAVKFELDDEEDISPLRKRSKLDSAALLEEKESDLPIPPSFYDPLSEPSPLGLSLKKSPSFLDLIQMKLSQQNDSAKFKKKGVKVDTLPGNPDKLKASNFPALLLKIGSWEYKSRYEGDLVVKCYYAKHKLVWEILDGELKNKIEIQWSDIVAIKANYSDDDGLGTLDVVLARQPLFFRETNPQPRKHTLWQATSDFTGGQASIHRQHYLQCSQDQLGKHFEKLVQCDPRLNFLSQQSEIVLESLYFEPRVSSFNDTKNGVPLRNEGGPPLFGVLVSGSPTASGSSLGINDHQDFTSRTPEHLYQQTPSPCSDTRAIQEIKSGRTVDATSSLDQWDLSKFRPSMSMTDLMNHIGHCISEQNTYSNPALSGDDLQSREILEEITQYLMADNYQQQHTCASAEKSIMSRVNCLCCLLNKDYEIDTVNADEHNNDGWGSKAPEGVPVSLDDSSDTCSGSKQQPLMSRKDSIGDFILFPRIASFPQFLFNIPEDTENRGR